MICPKCGNENVDDAYFCSICDEKLPESESTYINNISNDEVAYQKSPIKKISLVNLFKQALDFFALLIKTRFVYFLLTYLLLSLFFEYFIFNIFDIEKISIKDFALILTFGLLLFPVELLKNALIINLSKKYFLNGDLSNQDITQNIVKSVRSLFFLIYLSIVSGLVVILGTVFFIIPGIILAICFTFNFHVYLIDEIKPIRQIWHNSKEVAYDYWPKIILIGVILFVPVSILGELLKLPQIIVSTIAQFFSVYQSFLIVFLYLNATRDRPHVENEL